MKKAAARAGVFATLAHRKLSGAVLTASVDVKDPAAALERFALLLRDWSPDEDDTTVIRIMTSTAA